MDIRNILHKKRENKIKKIRYLAFAIIIWILIIMLILWIKKNSKKIRYNIWDNVQISGYINIDNNYPTNTHTISNEKTELGTKSSSINLNYLTNQELIFNCKIESISSKYPIATINNIKKPKSKLIIKDNKYFFTNELISFDFSKDTNIRAEKNDKYIEIFYQDQPIISVETFICNKVTPTQNCEQLIYWYTKNLNEMFTTFLWYTFYKNKENSRVTFNNQTLWYIFKTTNNDFLLDISHLINIIDSKFIVENKKELIMENCKEWTGTYLEQINKVSIEIVDQDLTKFNIDWVNNNKELANCKLTIDIRNDREIKNQLLKTMN